MGILKNIGKFIGNVVDVAAMSPIPEYVGILNAIVDLAVLAEAYMADPHGEVVAAELETESEYKWQAEAKTYKTSPAEVWMALIPGEDFSVRKAVQKYHELDDDGKAVFQYSAVSVGLHTATTLLMTRRWYKLFKDNLDLTDKYTTEKAILDWVRDQCDKLGGRTNDVVEYYHHHKDELKTDGDLANYNNMMNDRDTMRSILATIDYNRNKGGAAA